MSGSVGSVKYSLHLGQHIVHVFYFRIQLFTQSLHFISPIIVTPVSRLMFGAADLTGPYKVGILLCLLFTVQVYSTRHFQSLPPE